MHKIESLTILSSAACNLSCKYCYITQDEKTAAAQKKLIDKIKNEEFLSGAISQATPADIRSIGLWGLEPMLTLDVFSDRLDYVCKTLPNLETIHMSSNFQGDIEVFINLIKNVPKDKKLDLDLQVSIDGMPQINDLTRGNGSCEKIVNNVKKLISRLNETLPEYPNVKLNMHDKATFSAKIIEMYDEDRELLFKNYRFMEEFYVEMISAIKSHSQISFNGSGGTPEKPFDYSKKHGIAFLNILKNLDELIKTEKFKYVRLPLISRIKRIFTFGREFNNKQFMFTCSANRGSISIGQDDNFTFCHRDFFNDNTSINRFTNDHYIIHKDQNMAKRAYVTSCYSDFPRLKISQFITMCKELAYCGLIDESYADYDKAYTYAMLSMADQCPSDQLRRYGSPYISDTGSMILYGNGAMDYLIRRIHD